MAVGTNTARQTLCVPRESVDFVNGSRIGDYTIASLFREGSQATLFTVTAPSQQENVMRVYFDGFAPPESIMQAFHQTTDDQLCRVISTGIHGGHVYDIVEKLTPLPDIRQLSEEQQLSLVKEEAKAVLAIHTKSICHLDIKIEHFMRNASGKVVLIDIGSAKHIGDDPPAFFNAFLPPDAYTGPVRPESDLFSLGIAVLEQFFPEWLEGKPREEIITALSSQDEITRMIEHLPDFLKSQVRSLVSDNPAARKECAWFDSSRRAVSASTKDQKDGMVEQVISGLYLLRAKDDIQKELLSIVAKCNPGVFVGKVQPAARAVDFNDLDSLTAFLQFLRSIPRESSAGKFTNITKENIFQALSGEVVVSPRKLSKTRPVRTLKKYIRKRVFYIFDKSTILELDQQGAVITNERNRKAWAALRIIGIVIGVAAAVAVVIAIVIAILYILAIIAIGALLFILLCGALDL